ncbi:MAG: hypothetical protein L6Q54_06870 [Leptospiraceae bacterium]|nr:hypothetical protein [Leptospiraceae bacterium]MCK6380960.1 hypothetical protein [Leptospiraceae bacterium]NUM40945.1 hypothetical protein [Leptospiraceae bacterium]
MSSDKEKIQILNTMTRIIDEKAAKYKSERKGMNPSRVNSEKKLILDSIDDAVKLAKTIQPIPQDLIADLEKLSKQFFNMI